MGFLGIEFFFLRGPVEPREAGKQGEPGIFVSKII